MNTIFGLLLFFSHEKITNNKPKEKIEEEKIYYARNYPKNALGDLMKNPQQV